MSSGRIETNVSAAALDFHRALASLQEELEAVDYYGQRAENAADPELKALLLHNRAEEIEHAALLTEWLRRQDPGMDKELKQYLFTSGSLTAAEGSATGAVESGSPAPSAAAAGLGIGKIKA